LQRDKITGSPILLYPEGVLVLNAPGEAIIRLCDGTLSQDEIVEKLRQSFEAPREVIDADVGKLLNKLKLLNLMAWPAPSPLPSPE